MILFLSYVFFGETKKNIHALMRNKFNIGRGFEISVISSCFKMKIIKDKKLSFRSVMLFCFTIIRMTLYAFALIFIINLYRTIIRLPQVSISKLS